MRCGILAQLSLVSILSCRHRALYNAPTTNTSTILNIIASSSTILNLNIITSTLLAVAEVHDQRTRERFTLWRKPQRIRCC